MPMQSLLFNMHLFDLPDEILLMILKKLNNEEVLYSLLDVNNNRLDLLARDKQFTKNLDLVRPDQMILGRFSTEILPRIHQNVRHLSVQSPAIKDVLPAGTYPNLTDLKLHHFSYSTAIEYFQSNSPFVHILKHGITDLTLIFNGNKDSMILLKDYTFNVYGQILCLFGDLQHFSVLGPSIAEYPGLALGDLPSSVFSSSILTKLSIHVQTFDDCLRLLDGRLNRLTALTVRIYDIGISEPETIVCNMESLSNLKCFSLTCHSHIMAYHRVLALLRRMSNLDELTLCLTVRNLSSFIDGTHLKNEILHYMPHLNNFIFDIRSWCTLNENFEPLSNDDIQRTFTDIGYRQVGCSIRYFHGTSTFCHVFTLPFTFDYLQCLTNHFPQVIFTNVLYLFVFDNLPFEHEFFLRVAQAFPLLKHLSVSNCTPNANHQSSSIVKYPNLTCLSLMHSDVTYTEQFLLETKTHLPRLTEFRVNWEKLKAVTENFTRNATRLNCVGVNLLITDVILTHSNDFSLYFPCL